MLTTTKRSMDLKVDCLMLGTHGVVVCQKSVTTKLSVDVIHSLYV